MASSTENNPGVLTATAKPGMMSALGYDFGDTGDQVTVTGGIGSGSSGSGSGLDLTGFSPTLTDIGVDDTNVGSSESSAINASTAGSTLSSILSSMGLTSSNLGALAPEAAVAGIGLAQAKNAQSDAAKQAAQLSGPSQNLINAGNSLLQQFQSGKLTPTQQSYVDFTNSEGQALIDSGNGLKAIAQQAFGDYASGTLPQADQLKLDQQVAAQKQQIAQQLSSSGMADSSVLSAYNQQIDNQALITKQGLLDARFATGVTAYNTWLNSTTEGIQLKNQGAQFAQSAFESMMNDSLALESQGMSGLTQAIALTVQSDNQLSQSVSQLMGNLAAAYAYTVSGGGKGGTGGAAAAGSAGSILNSIVSKGTGAAANLLSGSGGLAAAGSGAFADSSGVFGDIASGAAAQEGSVAADVASDLGFSSAGGAAAGAGAAAAGGSTAAGLASSGSFATGGGAASAGGAGAGSLAAAAGPVAIAGAAFVASQLLGAAWTGKETQGNVAMKDWMKATGATWKPNPGLAYNTGSTFQTTNAQNSAASSPGNMYDASGKKMDSAAVSKMIHDWAVANGVNPGDFK
jgi:hypothetical protein